MFRVQGSGVVKVLFGCLGFGKGSGREENLDETFWEDVKDEMVLDESVFGRVFFFFANWMKVYLTKTSNQTDDEECVENELMDPVARGLGAFIKIRMKR